MLRLPGTDMVGDVKVGRVLRAYSSRGIVQTPEISGATTKPDVLYKAQCFGRMPNSSNSITACGSMSKYSEVKLKSHQY